MKKIGSVLILAFAFTFSNAQRPETGMWFAVNLPVSFSAKWQLHTDGGYRTLGTSFQPLQYLFRTGLRHSFNEQWNVAGGVAFFFTKTNFLKTDHEFRHEFRIWEEAVRQHLVNEKLQFVLRLRIEQRFFAATTLKDKYIAYRFRLRAALSQKLNDKWSLQLATEHMRQLVNQAFSFDQHRISLWGIYHLNKTAQLQAGLMWLKWPTDDQHILTFTFSKNISLYGS